MKNRRFGVITSLLPLFFSPQLLAHTELFVAPFGGYSFESSSLNATTSTTEEQTAIAVADASHYGIIVGALTEDPGDVYLLYSHQKTSLNTTDLFNSKKFVNLDLDYLHVGGSLYFPKQSWAPYITVSAGLTQLRLSGQHSDEIRFSMGFGVGVEYSINDSVSLFTDARGMRLLSIAVIPYFVIQAGVFGIFAPILFGKGRLTPALNSLFKQRIYW